MADNHESFMLAATLTCRRHLAAAEDAIAKLGKAADRADYERAQTFLKTARAQLASAQTEIDRTRDELTSRFDDTSDVKDCLERLSELEREIDEIALSFGQIRD